MSFLNSLVNQVGREVGRDLYKGAKASVKASNVTRNKNIVSNNTILYNIKNFQVSPYDKVTFRNINLLYQQMALVNPRSFDWEDCHLSFDELIDSLKISLKAEFTDSIEELDKQNSADYLVNKVRHTTFIDKLITDYQEKVDTYEAQNGLIILASTFIGLNAVFTSKDSKWLAIFGVVGMGYAYFSLYKTLFIEKLPIEVTIFAFSVLTLPTLIASTYRSFNNKSIYKQSLASLNTLKNYRNTLSN